MEEFELLKYEYVELFKLIKMLSWAPSGAEAKQMVDEGLVKVNGQVETQRRKKLRIGDVVELEDKSVTVTIRQ